jgi:DNA polymerase-3 subunit epsilon
MRDYHGALLDAELLLDVYLLMSINQNDLSFNGKKEPMVNLKSSVNFTPLDHPDVMGLPVIYPADIEIERHNLLLNRIKKESGGEASSPSL